MKEKQRGTQMNKKEIYHLLKRYRYIIEAIRKNENDVEIRISGRREKIQIDASVLTFVGIVQIVYNKENNVLIKNFMKINVLKGKSNKSTFSKEPLDKSTYYRYKNKFVDIIYHCCISKGLVTLEEILQEETIKES